VIHVLCTGGGEYSVDVDNASFSWIVGERALSKYVRSEKLLHWNGLVSRMLTIQIWVEGGKGGIKSV